MIRLVLIILFVICFTNNTYSQEYPFREDQMKLGLYYNDIILSGEGSKITKGISYSFSITYIRDILLSEDGKWAMGLGIGYSYQEYYTNIKITKDANNISLTQMIYNNYNNNKFSNGYVEIPIEFRWRTVNLDNYDDYYRIHLGFNFGYLLSQSSTFESSNKLKITYYDSNLFPDIKYGIYITLGKGMWSLDMYYGMNNIFSKDIKDQKNRSYNMFKVGWIVYLI